MSRKMLTNVTCVSVIEGRIEVCIDVKFLTISGWEVVQGYF